MAKICLTSVSSTVLFVKCQAKRQSKEEGQSTPEMPEEKEEQLSWVKETTCGTHSLTDSRCEKPAHVSKVLLLALLCPEVFCKGSNMRKHESSLGNQ